ncbi:MAG TPA: Rieske 2Fe-2S domain-containing protein [Polyangiaceae bacterium]|nr:Rieske 2Fe-2S domain-containing protein [Polyangiaceae bacterium]
MSDLLRFFHPVLPSAALAKKPVAVSVGSRRFALWRDAAGRPAAVDDACPHRNAPLSLGRVRPDGRLACAYHGWCFDGAGQGSSPSQPKLACKTNAYRVVERYDYLWLANSDVDEATLPALESPGFVLAGAFTTPFPAPIHICLDNFTEDEHFPYVHSAFGWTEEQWGDVAFEAKTFDDHTTATYVGPQRASPIMPLLGVSTGDLFHNSFETRFDPLRTVYTSHWTSARGERRRPIDARTWVFMHPEGERATRFHTFLFVRVAPGSAFRLALPALKIIARNFVRREWAMDARWVEHLSDTARELTGLRLGKYDKTVIRNRKLLKELYLGHGESELVQLRARAG